MKHIVFAALALCLMMALSACNTAGSNPSRTAASRIPAQSSNSSAPTPRESARPSASENSDSKAATGQLTASITPTEGWEKRDSLSDSRIQYVYADTAKAHNTLINLDTEDNIFGRTKREYAEKRMESQKLTLESWKPVFTDIADVTVGGYDALAYDVVTNAGELQKMIFIFNDSYVYIIQCTTLTEFWELVEDDFQVMVDSFALK